MSPYCKYQVILGNIFALLQYPPRLDHLKHKKYPNPVGKIAEKAVCRSAF